MICLNCTTEISGNFCYQCGQKSSTKRFTLHQIFSRLIKFFTFLDSGIVYTIVQLLKRPGHCIREYNQGKRVKLTGFLTFMIIIITIGLIHENLLPLDISYTKKVDPNTQELMQALESFSTDYPKTMILTMIPFFALSSFMWFRNKSKQNFAENLVLNTYRVSMELFLQIAILVIVQIINTDESVIFFTVNMIIILQYLYSVMVYYQYFSVYDYKKSKLLFKSLVVFPTGYIIYTIVAVFIFYILKY